MENKFGILSSSVNSDQLSATVSGAILSVAALIIMLGKAFGIEIASDQITTFASQAGLAAGSLWFLYGAIRKVIVKIAAPKQ
jgi:hypothetical protein